MRATLRWAHADLRTHRGEALFIVLATGGIITTLLLATALFSYAANPWQRTFTQSSGAHVWIHTSADADPGELARLARLDGVTSSAGPYRTARVTAEARGGRAALELRSAPVEPPTTSRPLLTQGRWLDASVPDGIVLESRVAEALWTDVGDTLSVPGGRGGTRELTVLGVADSAEPGYQPGARPGLGWVLSGQLDRTGSQGDQLGQVVGLRLDDPGDTGFAVQRAVTLLGADGVTQVSNWQQARSEAESDDRLLGLLLGVFGLGALLAAALAVAGAISSRIRGHLRDISVLKAIGFTPGQVVRIFLVQHLGFALLGALLGVALIESVGSRIPGRIGEAVGIWQDVPGHTASLLLVPAVAVLFIGVATSLAAWRAGRVPPVPVARAAVPPTARMSKVTRGALGLRLPPALVLGWRAAFNRRGRSLPAIARLTLPLLLITVALSAWSTLDRMSSDPAGLGLSAALTARTTDDLSEREAGELLAADAGVRAVHPGVEMSALAPGQTGTLTLRGLGTDSDPYPFGSAEVAEGRAPEGPDEAVAGQGVLDLLDLELGDWVRLTVEGRPQILHLVGRTIEPDQGGRIITTSLDTLRERDPELRPGFYQLELRSGADPGTVSDQLTHRAGGQLEIRAASNPAEGLIAIRGVIIGLIGVLALIGLTELLTVIGAGVKDRERDLLALKAIGLTPRQITAIIVTTIGLTTLAAALAGTALGTLTGTWLIDVQGRASGIGAGIAVGPPLWAWATVIVGAVAGALAIGVVPATRTARRRLADTLSAVP